MRGMRVVLAALIASLLGAGCAGTPTAAPKASTKSAKTGPLKPAPSTAPSADASTPPLTLPSSTTNNLTRDAYYGRVLGLDGKPAGNVLVRGQLVSNNGSGLVANNGSNIVAAGGNNYKVQQAGTVLMTRTDDEGYFELQHPNNQALNVEAELREDVKAIRMNVGADLTKFELQLAHTGLISGKVAAPGRPEVTNFQGVSVYIPGTSYQATADAAGNFTLANVPVGAFRLVAEKTGLGIAVLEGVTVTSKETTNAGQLALQIDMPTITALTAPNGGAGTQLKLTGQNFGASKGATFSVAIGGVACQEFKRVDDTTIELTVPPGAGDNVVVTVDGIPSAAFTFKTIDKLTLTPQSGGGEEYGPRTPYELDLGGTETFTVAALDKLGNAIPNPQFTWEPVTSPALTIADGVVTGKARGRSEVVARSGDQVARLPITVVDPNAPDALDPTGLALVGGAVYAYDDEGVYRFDAETETYETVELGLDEEVYVMAIAAGPGGKLYVALEEDMIAIDAEGEVTPVESGNLGSVTTMTVAADGTIYALTDDGETLKKLPAGSSTASTLATNLNYPESLTLDAQGNLYVFEENQVLKFVGTTKTAFAKLPRDYYVSSSAADGGNLYVTDWESIKKIAADGTISNVTAGTDYISAITAAGGKLYVADGNTETVKTITLP